MTLGDVTEAVGLAEGERSVACSEIADGHFVQACQQDS